MQAANAAAMRTALGGITEANQSLSDVTTADVSTTKHGYAPKAPNDATMYLDGTGAYSVPAGGGGGGFGTVTSVSVTTANGVSGSVATATTTPAITLALGAITPTSVAASGALSGTTLSTTGIVTSAGASVNTANALGAFAIDVTKGLNTKTVATEQTFTFSGTPASSNTIFGVKVINSDSVLHTLTIPSSYSQTQNAAITTVIIPASGTLTLQWLYDGTTYNIYGDPPLTTGTGSFVRATSPTLVTPALGTPASGVGTNLTGIPASALVAGVLGASITFGENTSLILDAALSADGKYCGITEAGTAGAALAFGDLVYLAVADSRWELTDADAEATAGPVKIGVCVLAAAADGDPTTLLLWGKIRADAAFPTLTIGAPAYVSTTAGDIQVAQPSGTDDVIRVVGYANTADELFFQPANDYMTHV